MPKRLKPQPQPEPAADPYDGLLPYDPLMAMAWVGGLLWAGKQPEIVAAFRRDTGCQWSPATNPMDAMIDQATGADADFARQFAAYWNENYWGTEDGVPVDVLEVE